MTRVVICVELLLVLALSKDNVVESLVSTTVGKTSSKNSSASEDDSFNAIMEEYWKIFSPTMDTSSNMLCRVHSTAYRDGLLRGVEWAVQMSDSDSSLHYGHTVHMGRYEQCVSAKGATSRGDPFSGQHCMVKFGPPLWFTEMEFIARREARYEQRGMVHEYPNKEAALHPLEWMSKASFISSVCIPSSCTPHDLERHIRTTMRSALGGRFENVTVRVGVLACSSRADTHEILARDVFLIFLLIFLGGLVIVGTAHDINTITPRPYTMYGTRRAYLLAFSVYQNFPSLIQPPRHRADSITGLEGIRVFSMLLITTFHRISLTTHTPTINPAPEDSGYLPLSKYIVRHASLSVDVLLMLSGLLLSHNFLRTAKRGDRLDLPTFYLRRYLRVTPTYALLMLMSLSHIGNLVNEGPLWKTNVTANIERCETNWLWGLVYLSNYLPLENMCMMNAWSLSMDMQLFWISPLLLVPLARWPRVGKRLLALLLLVGVAICIYLPYIHRFKVDLFYDYGEVARRAYMPTHARFTPWLIGIGLGYALHATGERKFRLSRVVSTGGWLLSLGLMSAPLLLAGHFLSPDYQYDRVASSLYIGLYRPGWILGLAWLVFACNRGYAGLLNKVLSWHPFHILSQLNYSVLMIHVLVMGNFFATLQTPELLTYENELFKFLRDILLTYAASLAMYFTVELPVNNVASLLLAKGTNVGNRKQK